MHTIIPKEQPEIAAMSIEFAGIELTLTALRYTLLRRCRIIIVMTRRLREAMRRDQKT